METSRIKYLGNLRTEATHLQSGSKFFTDAPIDNHGQGAFFSPTDLAATALGTCMLTIIGIAANTHSFSIEHSEAIITKIMSQSPRKICEIVVELHFKGSYTEKQKLIIENSAKTCPIALSLHPELKQSVSFFYEQL